MDSYSLSQALNKLISSHCFTSAYENDYLFEEIDLKNKKFFIDELHKSFHEHNFTEHNITSLELRDIRGNVYAQQKFEHEKS